MLVTQINWTPPVGWPDSVAAVEMTPYFLSLGKWGPLPCQSAPIFVGFKKLFFAESTVMNYHRVRGWISGSLLECLGYHISDRVDVNCISHRSKLSAKVSEWHTIAHYLIRGTSNLVLLCRPGIDLISVNTRLLFLTRLYGKVIRR